MDRLKIFVYRGPGVGSFSYRQTVNALRKAVDPNVYPNLSSYLGIEVKSIAADQLAGNSWQDRALLLVMPGGRDVPYHEALSGLANRQIRAYVERGGRFLGLCAGGYYGASAVRFAPGTALEVCARRELAFYPGIAEGPLYDPTLFAYDSEQGARAAQIDMGHGPFYTYYNGGCSFCPSESFQGSVLARYCDLPQQPAAVVLCEVGLGRAILSGVHLEVECHAFERRAVAPEVYQKLQQTDRQRWVGFCAALGSLEAFRSWRNSASVAITLSR